MESSQLKKTVITITRKPISATVENHGNQAGVRVVSEVVYIETDFSGTIIRTWSEIESVLNDIHIVR